MYIEMDFVRSLKRDDKCHFGLADFFPIWVSELSRVTVPNVTTPFRSRCLGSLIHT